MRERTTRGLTASYSITWGTKLGINKNDTCAVAHVQKSAEVSVLLNSQSLTMPSNRVTAGKKDKGYQRHHTVPTPKWTKKMPNKRPRSLTTDDIPVLVREVCKDLLPHQTEDKAYNQMIVWDTKEESQPDWAAHQKG